MNSQNARVGIVSVCYNSMSVLPSMLDSVPKNTPIVLVSNAGEKDDSPLTELATYYNANLIVNKTNKGFGVACNQGADVLNTELLLFINPDAVLRPKALDELLKAVDSFPEAVAFNPRIISSSGKAFFKRNSHLLPRSKKMARGWPKTDCEVSILSGAAFLVKRTIFKKSGGFDPEIFLYHEDDDLALRLSNEFGKLYFVYDALVMHMEGQSSERSPDIAALKAWHMGRSRVYATRKHNRPMPFARALFSALMQVFSLQVLFSSRKRAKHIAYLQGVISSWRLLNKS